MANNTLLASDNFASGSLAAGWAAAPTESTGQVILGPPNYTEANTVATGAAQIWTGLTWPNDHVCEVTVTLAGASVSTFVQLLARNQGGAQYNGYVFKVTASGVWDIIVNVNGTPTILTSGTGLTIGTKDVWMGVAAGSFLGLYQNGTRIGYFYDTTFTGGSPGFGQIAASSLANNKVYSWRGYSAQQQDGIWTKKQIVLPAILGDLNGSPAGQGIQAGSVLYEGNAQILSGTVFKMWPWNVVSGSTFYAESTDGINWTRKSSAVIANVVATTIYKSGSTYYAYGQASNDAGAGNMLVYTSSDGVTWSLQSPTNVLGLGGGGAWDSQAFYAVHVFTEIAGTYYGLYAANKSGDLGFSGGLATSTDLINWTKSGSNPVTVNTFRTGGFYKSGAIYYLWLNANQPGQGNPSNPDLDPTEQVRYETTDFIHYTNPVHSAHHSQTFESLNATSGQIYCAGTPINFGGKTYQYYNTGSGDAVGALVCQIELATAPASIASIVSQNEDGTKQIASDAFTSGTGNLSANWTTPTSGTKLQIVSGNLVEATVTTTSCTMYYSGSTFTANQYSEITIGALVNNGCYMSPWVRMQPGSVAGYNMLINGAAGTAMNTGVYVCVAGTSSPIGPTPQITPQIGDVFRLLVFTGSDGFPVLQVFQNGFLILTYQDYANTYTTGQPGMSVYAGVLADSQISLWAGGNASVIPTYASGYGISRSVAQIRKRRRHSPF